MCSAQAGTMKLVLAAPGNLMTCRSYWVFGNTHNRTFVYRHVCCDGVRNERVKKVWNNRSSVIIIIIIVIFLIGEIDRFNGKGPKLSLECSHLRVIKGVPVMVTNMWLYTEIVTSQWALKVKDQGLLCAVLFVLWVASCFFFNNSC